MISIVMPTRNSEKTLGTCLESIKEQAYGDYEIIIIDGNSTDRTGDIARQFTDKVYVSDASVPASRNLAFSKARGDIFLSIDSDMILAENLLEDIVEKINGHGALVIPEVGYGKNFLSKCKDLEKRLYIGDENIEAARVFTRKAFEAVGGYAADLRFSEDRELHCRIKEKFSIGRTNARIMHDTTYLSLPLLLKKSYNYGRTMPIYLAKRNSEKFLPARKSFITACISKLTEQPISASALLVIKCLEYSAGFMGFAAAKLGV